MIGFFEKTWFAWWILSNLVILRWFRVVSVQETIHPETDQAEPGKKSNVAASDLSYWNSSNHEMSRPSAAWKLLVDFFA